MCSDRRRSVQIATLDDAASDMLKVLKELEQTLIKLELEWVPLGVNIKEDLNKVRTVIAKAENDKIDDFNVVVCRAAPYMLATLKRIRDYLYERGIFGYMRMEVEAAIAKAGGRTE